MSKDFYTQFILPYVGIIIKICRAYTDTEEDFQDYYQEVCLQIWNSRKNFKEESKWSTWIYRISLNVCLSLLKKRKKNQVPSSDNIEVQNIPTGEIFFQDESYLAHGFMISFSDHSGLLDFFSGHQSNGQF